MYQKLPPPHQGDARQLDHRVLIGVRWQVNERQDGVWVAVKDFHNLLTNFGLTAYALAPSGQYTPPIYLVIDASYATVYNPSGTVPGVTSIQLTGNPTTGGDTQLVLSAGMPAQETVTFTSITGSSSPYTANLSTPTANSHANLDPVVRPALVGDTMSQVISEAQYDPTFNPGNRTVITAAYSPATAQGTMQFFLSGSTATNLFFAHVGLADRQTIGDVNTNLHNYAVLGYNHNNTNDLEIDVTYTLQLF
jgi:hypothetical protein